MPRCRKRSGFYPSDDPNLQWQRRPAMVHPVLSIVSLSCRRLKIARIDVLHNLFCRLLRRPRFLSHLRYLKGYDEPEILLYSTQPFCLTGADDEQPDEMIASY